MNKDKNNASFAYSVNLLRLLLGMKLITEEEYKKIVHISAAHYGADGRYRKQDYCLADRTAQKTCRG